MLYQKAYKKKAYGAVMSIKWTDEFILSYTPFRYTSYTIYFISLDINQSNVQYFQCKTNPQCFRNPTEAFWVATVWQNQMIPCDWSKFQTEENLEKLHGPGTTRLVYLTLHSLPPPLCLHKKYSYVIQDC